MNLSDLEKLTHQTLDNFYLGRLKRLSELKFWEILREKNAYLLRAIGTQNVSEIVPQILLPYMSSDETVFDDILEALWEELTGDPDFYLKVISLMRDYPQQHRLKFEEEWDKALNRFEYDFLANFGNLDGSINWEQLLRYNSGKEKVVWVSTVVPATVIEDQEDESDLIEEE